jgi:integrase
MIDRSGDQWIHCPDRHKTAHKGKSRTIPLVAEAQQILAPFLFRPDGVPCFSPAESAQWYRDQRTAKCKTKRDQGNTIGTNRKANPKKQPGSMFKKDSFNQAVRRACEKAGVKRWTPYQLRHLAATELRRLAGLDGAQQLLGHSHSATTEIYAKPDQSRAIVAAETAAKEIFPKLAV